LTVSRNQKQPETPPLFHGEDSGLVSESITAGDEAATRSPIFDRAAFPAATDPATIGKSLQIKGEVIGFESLYIHGKVEGAISLPNSRVTVGRDAQVLADITAREVVVLGTVRGNVNASDRVDLRSEGSLTGDVTTGRITVGDGAFFKGSIDISKPGQQKDCPALTVP
jgi:cytoskeletal protein CcmA (bactofilin family)